MLSKHGEIPTCEGAMPLIRWGKPMLSSNEKPCETTGKPTNYSYDKASICEGKKNMLSIRQGKPNAYSLNGKPYQMARKPMRRFIMAIPLLVRARLALNKVGKPMHTQRKSLLND